VIDSHCHLDVERFDADRPAVLERAWAAGLEGLVVPGIGPATWEALLQWPAREPRVQVALGVHPQLLPELPEADDAAHLRRLDELLARGVAKAVGECGLDGPSEAGAPMERQLRVLEAHFDLADAHRLPLVCHVYRAHPHFQRLLKRRPIPSAGLVLHSYSGSHELARFYAERGCHFSFAGPVTFTEARRPLEALRAIPPERLMAETDAPDQAPHPHRGQRSEPGYLPLIVSAMARAVGEDEAAFAHRLRATTRTFFRLA